MILDASNVGLLVPLGILSTRFLWDRPSNPAHGLAFLSVGSFVTLMIDGYHTGNPGPVHGLPAGLAWWGGVTLLILGWAEVLGSTQPEGQPTWNGILSLAVVPGALAVADHFLYRELPVHTYVAGMAGTLAAGAVLLTLGYVLARGNPP